MVHTTRPSWILHLIRSLYLLLPLAGFIAFTWWAGLIGLAIAYLFDIAWTKWATGLSWQNVKHMIGVLHRPRNVGHYVIVRVVNRKLEIISAKFRDQIHLVYKIPIRDWPEVVEAHKKDQSLNGLSSISEIADRSGHHWLCLGARPDIDRQVQLLKYLLDSADAKLGEDVYAKAMIMANDVWGVGPGESR